MYDTRNQNGLGDVGGELDRGGQHHLMGGGGGGLMDGITAAMGQDSLLRAGMGKSRRGVDSDEVSTTYLFVVILFVIDLNQRYRKN